MGRGRRCKDRSARYGKRKLPLSQVHFVYEGYAGWRLVRPGEKLDDGPRWKVRSFDRCARGLLAALNLVGPEHPEVAGAFPPVDELWVYGSSGRVWGSALPVPGAWVLRRRDGVFPSFTLRDLYEGPLDLTGTEVAGMVVPGERTDLFAFEGEDLVKDIPGGMVLVRVTGYDVPMMPGVMLKGGAARRALRGTLGLPCPPVRDLDYVVAVRDIDGVDRKLGIGVDDDLEDDPSSAVWDEMGAMRAVRRALSDRDVTLNEVALFADPYDPLTLLVACSERAFEDHRNGVVRRVKESESGYRHSRETARSIRFAADMAASGAEVSVEEPAERLADMASRLAGIDEDGEYSPEVAYLERFDLALQLERAVQGGSAYPYVALISRYMPQGEFPTSSPAALARELEGSFDFSPEVLEKLADMQETIDGSRYLTLEQQRRDRRIPQKGAQYLEDE